MWSFDESCESLSVDTFEYSGHLARQININYTEQLHRIYQMTRVLKRVNKMISQDLSNDHNNQDYKLEVIKINSLQRDLKESYCIPPELPQFNLHRCQHSNLDISSRISKNNSDLTLIKSTTLICYITKAKQNFQI